MYRSEEDIILYSVCFHSIMFLGQTFGIWFNFSHVTALMFVYAVLLVHSIIIFRVVTHFRNLFFFSSLVARTGVLSPWCQWLTYRKVYWKYLTWFLYSTLFATWFLMIFSHFLWFRIPLKRWLVLPFFFAACFTCWYYSRGNHPIMDLLEPAFYVFGEIIVRDIPNDVCE